MSPTGTSPSKALSVPRRVRSPLRAYKSRPVPPSHAYATPLRRGWPMSGVAGKDLRRRSLRVSSVADAALSTTHIASLVAVGWSGAGNAANTLSSNPGTFACLAQGARRRLVERPWPASGRAIHLMGWVGGGQIQIIPSLVSSVSLAGLAGARVATRPRGRVTRPLPSS